MKQLFAALVMSVAMVGISEAKDGTYKLTAENTRIEWTGTKADGKHDGGFKKLTGTAKQAGSSISFEVEIDTASLYSDHDDLTKHLKAPDFFSVKEHPKAKFKSTKIEQTSDGYKVTGDLTLLGKTKKVTFPATISTDNGLNVDAKFTINRQDFGMSYGTGKVHDDVQIRVDLHAK